MLSLVVIRPLPVSPTGIGIEVCHNLPINSKRLEMFDAPETLSPIAAARSSCAKLAEILRRSSRHRQVGARALAALPLVHRSIIAVAHCPRT
jgi:hypothetical protein